VESSAKEHAVWCTPQTHLEPYIIPKGSVAIDGVSLTIAEVKGDSFSVAIIPTTLDRTTFSTYKKGYTINIESDIITRTIVHHLSALTDAKGLTLEALQKAGFA